MMPSKPAVVVPIPSALFVASPPAPSTARRTAGERREPNTHILTLDPQLVLVILAEIDGQDHTGTARPALGNPEVRQIAPPAGGTPILHEFFGRILGARLGVRATEQCVRSLIIVRAQAREELLDLAFLAIIVKHEEERSAHDQQRHKRDSHSPDDLDPAFVTGAVLVEITGHLLFDYGSLWGSWSSRRIRFVVRGNRIVGNVQRCD